MPDFIGAIDQGTTSTRFLVFDRGGRIVASAQKEHEQIYPQPGWVEHDPDEIWFRTRGVIDEAMAQRGLKPADLAAIGITNQRETTVLWNRHTGKPVANALVWQDMRVAESVSEFSRHSPPISALLKSAGCSTASPKRVSKPKPATFSSATSTPSSPGISPACTSPIAPTPAARS